ncbi:MAG: 16S rRNA (uracil(1498)-N(3))-methyltransferase [Anaerolineae bacterium]
MHRFFVPAEWLRADPIFLRGPLAHQLGRVLRMAAGDHILLLDGSGWAYEVELERLAADVVTARRVAASQPNSEPRTRLTLLQALSREKKFDWVLQKGTEVGVTVFIPLLTRRGLLDKAERVDAARTERWARIVTEAAEQSGRTRIPAIGAVETLPEALGHIPTGALALVGHTGEDAMALARLLRATERVQEVWLLIGPEGGFDPDEVALCRRAGVEPVSLGPRILRTETAGLVAATLILNAFGDLDP